jgi:hypothetical protein
VYSNMKHTFVIAVSRYSFFVISICCSLKSVVTGRFTLQMPNLVQAVTKYVGALDFNAVRLKCG